MTNNKIILSLLPNFNINENWGDINKLNPAILVLMQRLRTDLDRAIHINCAYDESGHAENSQHYTGNAVDFSIDRGKAHKIIYHLIEDLLEEYELSDECGLGVYPFWNTPGFHLDLRGKRARWAKNKGGVYVAIKEVL